jgi:hypothetical protein
MSNTNGGPQICTDSPTKRGTVHQSSHFKNLISLEPTSPTRTTLSSTKSWCSSPFSNLGALSPDSHSLTFSLADLSPSLTFSSPRNRFSSEISSPQSSIRLPKDYASIFSPSLFSPFNKSLNPTKMDKLGLESDDLDNDSSRLLSAMIEDTPDM